MSHDFDQRHDDWAYSDEAYTFFEEAASSRWLVLFFSKESPGRLSHSEPRRVGRPNLNDARRLL